MASTEAAPEKGSLRSSPKAGQIIQHEDKEFETVKEGLAYILVPRSTSDASTSSTKNGDSAEGPRQDVFYNPIQQVNRDLSVLAIRAFGEHVIAVKTEKHAARMKHKTKRDCGKKRKREDEEAKNGEQPNAPPAKKACEDITSNNIQSDQPALDNAGKKEAEPNVAPEEPWKPSFSILDALSATGLRALRYAKEIPFATRVVANDISAPAIESIKANVQHNGVENVVQSNRGDACAYMYSAGAPKADKNAANSKFDAVDLDPYGTAVPFLDAAIQSVGDGGLLCITCTDAGVFAGAGYPEKTFALYGGSPIRGPHSHEGGLRLILNAIATSAAKYGISIEPLLSLSIDFYARVFVRIHKSPSETKFLASKTMVIYHCAHGCGSWKTQSLSEHNQKHSKTGIPFYTYKLSQGPTAAPNCDQCGFKTHLSGPMWSGTLHNPHFINRILSLLKDSDKTTYGTFNRIEGMLTTALEEDLNLGGGSSSGKEDGSDSESGPAENDDTQKIPQTFIPRTDPSLVEPHPFFIVPSFLSKIVHTATMPENMLRGALRHLGYRSTRSHVKPNSIRTDAPWSVIWEIMREWVRQKAPIKENALREGTPGAGIMRRGREKLNPVGGTGEDLRTLKRDILSAVESGKNLSELTTKIEAALYRSGAHRAGEATEGSKTENEKEDGESHPPSTGPDRTLQQPDPSTLEIVFDEELGRKAAAAQRKRLVRYQINPRANWGPLSRASKGNSST